MPSFGQNLENLENKILNIPSNIVDGMRRNNIANSIVLLLLLYVILAAPTMSPTVVKLFNNNFFKLVYIFLIMCLISQNPALSLVVAIILLVVLNKLLESSPKINPENNLLQPNIVNSGNNTTKSVENFEVSNPIDMNNKAAGQQVTKPMIIPGVPTPSYLNKEGGAQVNKPMIIPGVPTPSYLNNTPKSDSNGIIEMIKQTNMGDNSVINLGEPQVAKPINMGDNSVINLGEPQVAKPMVVSFDLKKDNVGVSCNLVCKNKTLEKFDNDDNNDRLTQRQQMMNLWEQNNSKDPAVLPGFVTKEQQNDACNSAAVNSSCDVLGTNKYHSTSHARVTVDNNPCPVENKNGDINGVYENIDKEYAWIN